MGKCNKIDYNEVLKYLAQKGSESAKKSAPRLKQIHEGRLKSEATAHDIAEAISVLGSKAYTMDFKAVSDAVCEDLGKRYEPFYLKQVWLKKYTSKGVRDSMERAFNE